MIEKELPQRDFDSVIRMIKTARLDVVKSLRTATQAAMARLGVGAGRTRSVKGVPEGSDQHDVGSIVTWMNKVLREDAGAIAQIIVMDVTARVRLEG